MITLKDYWMGRDLLFPLAMTPDIEANALRLLEAVNGLLKVYGSNPGVRSGWRPPAINAITANAALNSKHMIGQAIDLNDPDGELDDWLMDPLGQATLEAQGLWMEHPAATKSWCHLQSVPPKSKRRVFYP